MRVDIPHEIKHCIIFNVCRRYLSMNVVATARFLLEGRCEFQSCTKHNMFSANARDIAVGDMNLCDLLKKTTQGKSACVYGRTTISTRRERNGSIRMENKLMMIHSCCFVV